MKKRRVVRHKFNNAIVKKDNLNFASKKEAAYYDHLKELREKGDVVFFLFQVPFHLPGGIKYIVDFVEFHSDGTVHFIDVKGMITDKFKLKKKLVEATYPVEIEVVKSW